MKPIPALDENGDWIEADIVDGSRVLVLAMGDDYAHTLVGNHVWRMDADTFKDWSAVRERVERARKAHKTKALADQVMRDLMENGLAATRIDPLDFCKDYDPAASKDHGEARTIPFVPPNIPIIRQPKRPSFAEALSLEVSDDIANESKNPNRPITPAMLFDWLMSARAASGE